jgi:hypothetical protein
MTATVSDLLSESQSLTPAEISEFERIATKLQRLESLVAITIATAMEIQEEMERARSRIERRRATEAAAAAAVANDRAARGAGRARS